MFSRAKRIFSRVVVTAMIAAPALAAHPGAASARTETSAESCRQGAARHARKATTAQLARRAHFHGGHARQDDSRQDWSRFIHYGHGYAGGRRGARYAAARTGRFGHDGEQESIRVTMSETGFVNDGGSLMRAERAETRGAPGQGRVIQSGLASWYGGPEWQGRRAADGSRFNENELTAAHSTLPLGSLIRVAMRDGSASVVVRITDRPGTRSRIIDLSRAAASRLGILDRGVAMVTLETP